MEDDLTSQNDEIEALASIYGDDGLVIQPSSVGKSFELKVSSAILRVNLPPNYPSISPPTFDILAPFLSREQKEELDSQLCDILSNCEGMPAIFSLSECVKEFIEERKSCELSEKTSKIETSLPNLSDPDCSASLRSLVKCPAIITGDCIEDRKSVFQGHFAMVQNLDEIKAVIAKLLENRKIANATHNMYAYRIKQHGGKLKMV